MVSNGWVSRARADQAKAMPLGVFGIALASASLPLLPALPDGGLCFAEPAIAEHAEALLQQPLVLQPAAERWLQAAQSPWNLAQFDLTLRTPLKVDVVRDRAALARIVAGGKIENVYRLQIMNATEKPQTYRVTADGMQGLAVASESEFSVQPAEARWVVLRLQVPYGSAEPGSHKIHFQITTAGGDAAVAEKSVFLMPR